MIGNTLHKPGIESHLYGIARDASVITKISQTKIAHPERNASFKGSYITPAGTFASIRHAAVANNVPNDQRPKRCSNPMTIINARRIAWNPDLTTDHLGKTFKELGWDFLPTPSESPPSQQKSSKT